MQRKRPSETLRETLRCLGRLTFAAVCFAPFLCLPARANTQQHKTAAAQSLVIGSGDVLSMHVFREDELTMSLSVKDDGTVLLPLIGVVPVAGLAPADAAARIASLYRKGQYLNDPQVSLLIEQSAAENVAVLGEVEHPGSVVLTSPRGLLDVLAAAGGLTKSADRHITVRRPSGASVTVFVPNSARADLAAAPVLVSPGDTVIVPRAGIVYVLGDVGRPGGYLMQDDSHLSLMQALALASGSSKTASEGHARLIRSVDGVTTEIPLELKAREKGKLPDLPLRDNDIVYIPFSLGKNLALGSASIAASASSALIYANY
jgi:polysaccharide export outer membrane protein